MITLNKLNQRRRVPPRKLAKPTLAIAYSEIVDCFVERKNEVEVDHNKILFISFKARSRYSVLENVVNVVIMTDFRKKQTLCKLRLFCENAPKLAEEICHRRLPSLKTANNNRDRLLLTTIDEQLQVPRLASSQRQRSNSTNSLFERRLSRLFSSTSSSREHTHRQLPSLKDVRLMEQISLAKKVTDIEETKEEEDEELQRPPRSISTSYREPLDQIVYPSFTSSTDELSPSTTYHILGDAGVSYHRIRVDAEARGR